MAAAFWVMMVFWVGAGPGLAGLAAPGADRPPRPTPGRPAEAAAAAAAAAAEDDPGAPAGRGGPAPGIAVDLGAETLAVRWRFARPRTTLSFPTEAADAPRSGRWRVPAGAEWLRVGGADLLRWPAPRTELTVTVPALDAPEVWRRGPDRFVDVGLLLPDAPAPRAKVTVRGPPGSTVALAGRSGAPGLTLTAAAAQLLESTPVYVGPREPADYGDFQLVVAPGVPAWMRAVAHAYLPRVSRVLAELAGGPLGWKPTLYLRHRPDPRSEVFEVRPGGQGGLLELESEGNGWEDESPEATVDWVWSLSHHFFHLYNQEAFQAAFPEEDEWLVEGAADFAALAALRALDLVTPEDAAGFRGDYLRGCEADLAGPLLTPGAATTSCGAALWLLAAEAARGAGAEPDLIRGLFDRADARYRYSRFGFFEALRTRGASAAWVRALQRLVEEGPAPGRGVRELEEAAAEGPEAGPRLELELDLERDPDPGLDPEAGSDLELRLEFDLGPGETRR